MSGMRLFFAVRPPEAVRVPLWRALAPLREAAPGVRWAAPELYHVTLRFLGDVAASRVPRLAAAAEALKPESAFPARLTHTGTFPPRGIPRVYWVGVRAEPLIRLRRRLDAAIAGAGVPKDDGRFAPHLTIGRVRRGRRTGPAERLAGRAPRRSRWFHHGPPNGVPGEFIVRAVHLVRSELFPTGPRYTNIHKVMLSTGGEVRSDREDA